MVTQLIQDSAASGISAVNRDSTDAAAQEQLEDVVLHSTNQFYKWHSELEAAFAHETEEKYKQYATELEGRLSTCADILSKVRHQACSASTVSCAASATHAALEPVRHE